MRFISIGGGLGVLLAVAAIGCGSGGATTEAPLTKAQFIKRGDAICRTAQKKREKILLPFVQELSKEGKELYDLSNKELSDLYSARLLPPVKEASVELDELTPPTGDVLAEKLVDALVTEVEQNEEDPMRAVENPPYLHIDRLAYKYGFKVCSVF